MGKKLGQEPAYPLEFKAFKGSHPNQTTVYHSSNGISKRFYAACAAMQGILSADYSQNISNETLIKQSYMLADELLKQESNG